MSWRKFFGNPVVRKIWGRGSSAWQPVEDFEEWPHWRHAKNHLLRIFPPRDDSGNWLVAVYESREGKLHPVKHQVFEGENAEIDAFCLGSRLAEEDRAKKE